MGSWNETAAPANDTAMLRVARGHVEQLPSGSFRAVVYAGVDPLTRRPVYLKATATSERAAGVRLVPVIKPGGDHRSAVDQDAQGPDAERGYQQGTADIAGAHDAVSLALAASRM